MSPDRDANYSICPLVGRRVQLEMSVIAARIGALYSGALVRPESPHSQWLRLSRRRRRCACAELKKR